METLERLYDEHAQRIFSYVLNLLRSEPETRDILQELFCKLAQRPALLAGVRDERGFLLRMAHNLAVDLIRRRATRAKNEEALAQEEAGLFAASENPDEARLRISLSEALAALPMEQRTVAHLKLWEGATFEQIGRILGISPNTAASRYRYSMDKMRARLRPIYEEIKS